MRSQAVFQCVTRWCWSITSDATEAPSMICDSISVIPSRLLCTCITSLRSTQVTTTWTWSSKQTCRAWISTGRSPPSGVMIEPETTGGTSPRSEQVRIAACRWGRVVSSTSSSKGMPSSADGPREPSRHNASLAARIRPSPSNAEGTAMASTISLTTVAFDFCWSATSIMTGSLAHPGAWCLAGSNSSVSTA
ncbi:hypothetical protein FQZ97_857250 [compost metagenome]